MTEQKSILINRAENRLRLLMTITIFFSTLVLNFFIFAKAGDESAHANFLHYAGLIGIYLITYIVFAIFGNRLTEKQLAWFDYVLLTGMASFIFPILALGTGKIILQNSGELLSFTGSLALMFVVAALALAFVVLIPAWNYFRKSFT